jgi:hypothetical protein
MTSPMYRYAADCGSPKPRPRRGMSPLSRNHGSANEAYGSSPARDVPLLGPDLAAMHGRLPGRGEEQGDSERRDGATAREPLSANGDLRRDLFCLKLRASLELRYACISAEIEPCRLCPTQLC